MIFNLDLFDEYLICDAGQAVISNGSLEEELILYNVDPLGARSLFSEFHTLTGKNIDRSSHPDELSGGQKVILMALLALHSPAKKILFIDLYTSLDLSNRKQVDDLIARYASGRKIVTETSQC